VDLLDLLILALRLLLVVLLYLFLATVMRMAMGGLRPPRPHVAEPVALPVLRLVVIEPGTSDLAPGQAVELTRAATLGRAERADIVLADPAVSSEHARVSRVGRAWVISDLGSTNGTRVNERRVDRDVPLANGDVLTLGNVRFRVGRR
jgi:Inner membrane component of T3SS, cytoplasmic domain